MRIKNWENFQHFKDRDPIWIKLYRSILDQRDISLLSDRNFRILVGCWLLASEDKTRQGLLPPVEDIAFRLRTTEKQINESLQALTEWIEVDDINTISERYQDDALEKRREEKEKRRYGEFDNVMLSDEERQKLEARFNSRTNDFIERLSAYIAQSGKKYKSHYATILNWARKDAEKDSGNEPYLPKIGG